MTKSEIAAFNAGVAAVAALASAAADVLRARLSQRPTRFNYAISALEGIADEARAMIIGPNDPPQPVTAMLPPRAPAPTEASRVQPKEAIHDR